MIEPPLLHTKPNPQKTLEINEPMSLGSIERC